MKDVFWFLAAVSVPCVGAVLNLVRGPFDQRDVVIVSQSGVRLVRYAEDLTGADGVIRPIAISNLPGHDARPFGPEEGYAAFCRRHSD